MKIINGPLKCNQSINCLFFTMGTFCAIILDLENELSRMKEASGNLPE